MEIVPKESAVMHGSCVLLIIARSDNRSFFKVSMPARSIRIDSLLFSALRDV